jgi:hypothetical protein
MKKSIRAWIAVAVMTIATGTAFALGWNGIIDTYVQTLQNARAGFDAAGQAKVDAAILEAQKAPANGEFVSLGATVKAAGKSVGKLGTLASDESLSASVAAVVTVSRASLVGRAGQAGTAAQAKLPPLKFALIVLKMGKITGPKADKIVNNVKLKPHVKLAKLSALAKQLDGIYNKYSK